MLKADVSMMALPVCPDALCPCLDPCPILMHTDARTLFPYVCPPHLFAYTRSPSCTLTPTLKLAVSPV